MTDDTLVLTWRDIRGRYAAVSCALERELQDRHGIGLSEYEALESLVECGEDMRAQQLTEALPLTQSAASRLVARLEKHGLVNRGMCEMDRRGVYVCLTAAGRARYADARPTYRAVLADLLG